MGMKVALFIFLVLFFPLQLFAGVGDHDNRYYVTDEMWAQEPYKKFVLFEMGFKSLGKFYPLENCTAQYVAPNLILTARHCIRTLSYAIHKATNYKKERFNLQLIEYGDKAMGDWALLLVKNKKYYSDAFFDIATINKQTDLLNAGWGWLRILTDDEINTIIAILESYKDKGIEDITIENISTEILEDLNEHVRGLIDTENRLKASYGHAMVPLTENSAQLKDKIRDKQEIADKLREEFRACVPEECREKLRNISYAAYNECLPETCTKKLEELSSVYKEIEALQSQYQLLDPHVDEYPYIIEHTCDTWSGNSGGALASIDGQKLYGISNFGTWKRDKISFNHRNFMVHSLQFEDNIKKAKDTFSALNTGRKNLKILENRDINDDTLQERVEEDIDEIEATKEDIEQELKIQQEELYLLSANFSNLLRQDTGSNKAKDLQLLDAILQYQVKSERLEKLEKAYRDARDKEQSTANKLLTAAAVAAGGLGGMEWASGRAEQRADAAAEREMSAYIATMKCEYGDGGQVDLGKEETLPGGNEMLSYYTEFKQLAEKLRTTKTALNLRPGIEAEVIYDRAETGLYDYQTAETGGGANPSLSRALMNPDGTDAAAWNAQKQESADKVQSGKTTAGIGVIGGAVGNAAINTDVIKNVVEKIRK